MNWVKFHIKNHHNKVDAYMGRAHPSEHDTSTLVCGIDDEQRLP